MSPDEWNKLPLQQKKKNKSRENPVKAACREWLDAHKIIHNRQQSGMVQVVAPGTKKTYWMHLADEGSGDLVGLTRKGRYFEIETKAPKGGVWAKKQQGRKRIIEASGGIYILAHSVDDLVSLLAL